MSSIITSVQTIACTLLSMTAAYTIYKGDYILTAIPGIAAIAYGLMLIDPANMHTYLFNEWSFTTPFMLTAILVTTRAPIPVIIATIVSDLLMITLSYLGGQETDTVAKYRYYLLSFMAFLPILYYFIGV